MTLEPYLIMAAHVAGFAFWSSFWPRRFVKERLEPALGFRAYRLLYNAGTIFLFGAVLLYLFQNSARTVQLWNWRGEPWLTPLVMVLLGISVFFLGSVPPHGKSFWGFAEPDPDAIDEGLQVRGYYKITRHPMYWSIFFLLLGHVLVLGSGLALVCFAALELYNVLGVIFFENPELERRYGESFRDYRRKISTIPFLSVIEERVSLTREDIPPGTLAGLAMFYLVLLAIHDPVIVFLIYELPTIGNLIPWFAERLGFAG